MMIDPYSIPPPRGWSPPVNPDQQVIPPPIGSHPVGDPLPPPHYWAAEPEPLTPAHYWSPETELPASFYASAESPLSHIPADRPFGATPPVSTGQHTDSNPYPIRSPIGSTPPAYPLTPPRGWTPSVELDPDLLHPPGGYTPSPSDHKKS
ncbi:MAG: hypothetical protein MUF72_22895 [Elainella sp. Prado103]|nr:hypothetical protein [Elainella sp. Prado103]